MSVPQIYIDGIGGTYDVFGLLLTEGSELPEAEVKQYTIDIPGGNGCIDLTDSLADGPVYGDVEQTLVFEAFNDVDIRSTRSRLVNALSGRLVDYRISLDPDYTYRGRWIFGPAEYVGSTFARFTVRTRTEPYKLKETRTYRVNAAGGIVVTLESGRMPVCPVFEFASETIVSMGGVRARMQPGSYKINDLWLSEGRNEVYINSYLGDGNVTVERYLQDTVAAHRDQRASDLMWEGVRGAAVSVAEWADDTVEAHKAERVLEAEFSVDASSEKFSVYVQYDWKDL
ncbi:hypothetical protein [Eggerthella sinensis]|uniref:Uncharacterized protein n=1 Tax=Eggerthella sinensis TaxID=242230 RepID=A0A3N0INT9_9ACTN|nr:hypothetical protein [Eggerthella sinensis]RDB70680.1 hypothetical protein C1876_02910 [Eggerthella sinensis]RNM38645.1 hypothetical protein DMP09_17415 [Eggerthella sinensis]